MKMNIGRTLSFSHLASAVGRSLGARAESDPQDPDKKDQDAEGEDDGDNPDQKKKDQDARGRADGDADPDQDAEGEDDGDGDADAPPESKKGKTAEGEDSDKKDETMKAASYRAGRQAERARCARIMGAAVAGQNPVLAANLAFGTGLSSKAAISILTDTPAAASAVGAGRGARNPNLGSDAAAAPQGEAAIASRWDKNMQKVSRARR